MQPSPSDRLMQFVLGKWISKPIYVAASLGVADLLADGPLAVDTLARRCDAHAPSLYRVLRALAAVGIFREVSAHRFALTPMAECLQSGALRAIAVMFHSRWHDRAWDHLLSAVKTGDAAFEIAHGIPAFEWLKQNPAAADEFHAANAVKAHRFHQAVLAAHDFSRATAVADIGGGRGALMVDILCAHPRLEGLVFDQPDVAAIAAETVGASAVAERCRVVAGDFFSEVPAGAGIYLLVNVLHNWDDERCRIILANCLKAMATGAKLLVIEAVVPPGNEFSIAKLLDIESMVMGGGRERTEEEYCRLLAACGFSDMQLNPMPDGNAVLAAVRS